jgi:hypothetical protein
LLLTNGDDVGGHDSDGGDKHGGPDDIEDVSMVLVVR